MNKFISVDIESIWFSDDISFFDDALNQPVKLIVCNLLTESVPISKWKHRLQQLLTRAKSANKTVILIINSWYKKDKEVLIECGTDEVVFLDFFLTLVYIRLIKNQESLVRNCWNPNSTNWLFLTGKANKSNRLPLLYRFYQDSLLEKCCWSLFITDNNYKWCKQCLIEFNENDADKWLEKFARSPDNIEVLNTKNGTHYSGIPYGNIYQSCLFQLISETDTDNVEPWITEKTWIPIINYTPFLIFGNPDSNLKLRQMGFLTFDEFLYDGNFDKSVALDKRVDSIIKNIRYWLENLSKNTEGIISITDYNHRRLLELANENINKLKDIHLKYKMDKDNYSLVLFADSFQHAQWKNWYNRIKDPSWPDCHKEEDFNKLPKWIQQECVEVFNYRPMQSGQS